MCCEFQDGGCSNGPRYQQTPLSFRFKANIMQEKDQKSLFDLYSGSKEMDFLEKFGIGPVILKKVLCIVIALNTSKVTRVVSYCKLTQTINR